MPRTLRLEGTIAVTARSVEAIISQFPGFDWRALWHRLTLRFDKQPIASASGLIDFVETRAAYVAQTSLYGYLKTRIGTRYPETFQDEAFAASINVAKWRIFAACLADLTVFAVATAAGDGRLDPRDAAALARFCFEGALRQAAGDTEFQSSLEEVTSDFAARAEVTDWAAAAVGETAFWESPAALIQWAPVVEEFKELDRDIVTNSIRFRWNDVRDQARRRIDGNALCRDWRKERSQEAASEQGRDRS